jgi:hypothetical protein
MGASKIPSRWAGQHGRIPTPAPVFTATDSMAAMPALTHPGWSSPRASASASASILARRV